MSQRIIRLDLARIMLVGRVIFGHIIERAWPNILSVRSVYIFVYAFHIPAFVFICGLVARPNLSIPAGLKLLERIVQPLIVCQIIFWIIDIAVLDTPMNWAKAPTTPYWLLWFLLSLLFWRILLIPFSRIPFALTISVVIALASGIFDDIGYRWTASRTLVFFPFFLAGYAAGQSEWRGLPETKKMWPYAIGVFAIAGFTAWQLGHAKSNPTWLYHSSDYGINWQIGVALRAAMLGVSGLLVWAFLCLVPNVPKQFEFIAWSGQYSLLPYLTHGLLIKGFLALGYLQWLHQTSSGVVVLSIGALGAITLSLFLPLSPLRQIQEVVFMPSRLFKR